MNIKSRVVVVVKKKKNYIYSKIPRFQRFAGTSGKMRKQLKNHILLCVALADTVLLSQIISPTGCPIFKNWNFGIFTGYPQVIHEILFINQRLSKVPILCSKLEQLYIRGKYWNSKLEFAFWSDSKIPISDSKIPTGLERWNKFHAPLKRQLIALARAHALHARGDL